MADTTLLGERRRTLGVQEDFYLNMWLTGFECYCGLALREHSYRLSEGREVLGRCLDLTNGLLDKLISTQVLSHDECQAIKAQPIPRDKVYALIEFFKSKTCQQYRLFLETLLKDNQKHVYNWLTPSSVPAESTDIDWPLSDEQVLAFDSCRSNLVDECLDATDELLDHLVALRCIHINDRQRIAQLGCCYDRAATLLDVIRSRGTHGMAAFLQALELSSQKHAADKIRTTVNFPLVGASLHVRIIGVQSMPSDCASLSDVESQIFRILSDFVETRLATVNQRIDALLRAVPNLDIDKAQLVSVRKGSIYLDLLVCSDRHGHVVLQRMARSMTSHIQPAVEQLFSELIPECKQFQLQVEFCLENRPTSFRGLPFELLEVILLKTMVAMDRPRWFRTRCVFDTGTHGRSIRSRACPPADDPGYPYFSLSGVCRLWADVLQGRYFVRMIRRCLNSLYRPYRHHVIKTATLDPSGWITGIAQLASHLYVTTYMSDVIRVYDVTSVNKSYKLVDQIQTDELRSPWDMAACSKYNRLYVTDFETAGIWYFELSETQKPSSHNNVRGWLIKGVDNPRGISVTADGNVVVVSWELTNFSTIRVFDPLNGEQLNRVLLPPEVGLPHHAVEVLKPHLGKDLQYFIVGHGKDNSCEHRVCLIAARRDCDSEHESAEVFGEVKASFGGRRLRDLMVGQQSGCSNGNFADSDFERRRRRLSASRSEDESDSDLEDDDELQFVVAVDEDVFDDASGDCEETRSGLALADIDIGNDCFRHIDTPYAVAVDQQGNVLVADHGGGRILVLDSNLQLMRTLLTGLAEVRQVWLDHESGTLSIGQDTGVVDVYRVS